MLYLKGYAALRGNDIPAAADLFSQVTQLLPDNEKAYTYLAIALLAMDEPEKAAEACGAAIRLQPKFVNPHVTLGDIHYRAERFEQAAASYSMAVQLDNDLLLAHYGLGNALRQLERFGDAALHYERASEIDPKYWRAPLSLAGVRRNMGRREAAIEAYEKAYATEQKNPALLHAFGDVLQELDRVDEASRYYREELSINHDSARALFALTTVHAISPHDNEHSAIEKLLENDEPSNSNAVLLHFALGNLLHEAGDFEGAFNSSERAMSGRRLGSTTIMVRTSESLSGRSASSRSILSKSAPAGVRRRAFRFLSWGCPDPASRRSRKS